MQGYGTWVVARTMDEFGSGYVGAHAGRCTDADVNGGAWCLRSALQSLLAQNPIGLRPPLIETLECRTLLQEEAQG